MLIVAIIAAGEDSHHPGGHPDDYIMVVIRGCADQQIREVYLFSGSDSTLQWAVDFAPSQRAGRMILQQRMIMLAPAVRDLYTLSVTFCDT